MGRLLLYPGECGPLVGLEAFLRDAHNDAVASREAEIKRAQLSGAPPPPSFPAWEHRPDLDGITVRLRGLSERVRREIVSRIIAASEGEGDDRMQAVSDARADAVAVGVDEIRGLEGSGGPIVIKAQDGRIPTLELEALRMAGLHNVLYEAMMAFQMVDAKKALRYGQSAASASSGSSVASVQSFDAASVAASEEVRSRILPAQNTKQTNAQGAT